MFGLAGSAMWRLANEATANTQSGQAAKVSSGQNQPLTQAQLIQYANQLAQERQRLIAYRLELDKLVSQLYEAQGLSSSLDDLTTQRISSQLIRTQSGPVPALADSVQGNSNGS